MINIFFIEFNMEYNYKSIINENITQKSVCRIKQDNDIDIKKFHNTYNTESGYIICITRDCFISYIYSLFGFNKEFYDEYSYITDVIIQIIDEHFNKEFMRYEDVEKQRLFEAGFNEDFEIMKKLNKEEYKIFSQGDMLRDINIYTIFINKFIRLKNMYKVVETIENLKKFIENLSEEDEEIYFNNIDDDSILLFNINSCKKISTIKLLSEKIINYDINDIDNIYDYIKSFIGLLSIHDIVINEFYEDDFDEELYSVYLSTIYCYLLVAKGYPLKKTLHNDISIAINLWTIEDLYSGNFDENYIGNCIFSELSYKYKINIYIVMLLLFIKIYNDTNDIDNDYLKIIYQYINDYIDIESLSYNIDTHYIEKYYEIINFMNNK